jgi:uncharacterized protein YjiS (DUF1127 family)
MKGLIIPFQGMQISASCIATFALLRCEIRSIFPLDETASLQGLNRQYEGEFIMLLSLIRMIQAFREYQRNLAELSQLSDRELADIGLDRSDIQRVAAGSYNG